MPARKVVEGSEASDGAGHPRVRPCSYVPSHSPAMMETMRSWFTLPAYRFHERLRGWQQRCGARACVVVGTIYPSRIHARASARHSATHQPRGGVIALPLSAARAGPASTARARAAFISLVCLHRRAEPGGRGHESHTLAAATGFRPWLRRSISRIVRRRRGAVSAPHAPRAVVVSSARERISFFLNLRAPLVSRR